MYGCPYTNQCQKPMCNFACARNGIYISWANRCKLKLDNPAYFCSKHDVIDDTQVILRAVLDDNPNSRYTHLSFVKDSQSKKRADRICYVILGKYIDQLGVSNGLYSLDFDYYLSTLKESWSMPEGKSAKLDELNIQSKSAKYLIIYNLDSVRFGDFESQTLMRMYQSRNDVNKYTINVLGNGKYPIVGKSESIFYARIKDEMSLRGVSL